MKINYDDFYTVYGVKSGLVRQIGNFDYRPFKMWALSENDCDLETIVWLKEGVNRFRE